MEDTDNRKSDYNGILETSDKFDSFATNRALDAFRSIYETALLNFDAKSAEDRISKANDLLQLVFNPLLVVFFKPIVLQAFNSGEYT